MHNGFVGGEPTLLSTQRVVFIKISEVMTKSRHDLLQLRLKWLRSKRSGMRNATELVAFGIKKHILHYGLSPPVCCYIASYLWQRKLCPVFFFSTRLPRWMSILFINITGFLSVIIRVPVHTVISLLAVLGGNASMVWQEKRFRDEWMVLVALGLTLQFGCELL